MYLLQLIVTSERNIPSTNSIGSSIPSLRQSTTFSSFRVANNQHKLALPRGALYHLSIYSFWKFFTFVGTSLRLPLPQSCWGATPSSTSVLLRREIPPLPQSCWGEILPLPQSCWGEILPLPQSCWGESSCQCAGQSLPQSCWGASLGCVVLNAITPIYLSVPGYHPAGLPTIPLS